MSTKSGEYLLVMEATARTYRYLDQTERDAQKAAAQKDKAKSGGNK